MEGIHSPQPEPTTPTQEQLLGANIELFAHASAIPLRNRLRYLVGDEAMLKNSHRYVELDELAVKLGTYPEDLVMILLDLGVTFEMMRMDEFDNLAIAPGLDAVVTDEFNWRKAYDALPREVLLFEITALFGITYNLAERIIKTTGLTPRYIKDKGGAPQEKYYPREILHRIRAEIMMFPPARQWKTLPAIIKEIGCGEDWAKRRRGAEFVPELMRTPRGLVAEHYPPEFEQYLQQEHDKYTEAEIGLLTVSQLADRLGRDRAWVEVRLMRYHRERQVHTRYGKQHTFYSKEVFRALDQESKAQRNLPVATEDEETINELRLILKVDRTTVERALGRLGIDFAVRRSANTGKVVQTYSKSIRGSVARAVIAEREELLAAHQVTIAELAARPKGSLTSAERKRLGTARQQSSTIPTFLESIRETYEKLMSESIEKQG